LNGGKKLASREKGRDGKRGSLSVTRGQASNAKKALSGPQRDSRNPIPYSTPINTVDMKNILRWVLLLHHSFIYCYFDFDVKD